MKILSVLILLLLPLPAWAQASFKVLNPKVQHGDTLIIQIAPQWMPPATSNPAILIGGIQYYPNKYGEVFIGISLETRAGKYIAVFTENGLRSGLDYEEIEIDEANFPIRKRGVFIPTKRWKQEREVINKIFDNGDYLEKYFDGKFIKPLDEIVIDQDRKIGGISSSFGNSHAGVDLITLDPGTGKHQRPVKAVNSGKVALIARNYSIDGNMIIIDHGSGIFSVYMHLSKFSVHRVGDLVVGGEIIGTSGRSGGAARGGPHLHFAIKIRNANRIQDVYVDPLKFIETLNQLK